MKSIAVSDITGGFLQQAPAAQESDTKLFSTTLENTKTEEASRAAEPAGNEASEASEASVKSKLLPAAAMIRSMDGVNEDKVKTASVKTAAVKTGEIRTAAAKTASVIAWDVKTGAADKAAVDQAKTSGAVPAEITQVKNTAVKTAAVKTSDKTGTVKKKASQTDEAQENIKEAQKSITITAQQEPVKTGTAEKAAASVSGTKINAVSAGKGAVAANTLKGGAADTLQAAGGKVKTASNTANKKEDGSFVTEIKTSSAAAAKEKAATEDSKKDGENNKNKDSSSGRQTDGITAERTAGKTEFSEISASAGISRTETENILKTISKALKPAADGAPDPNKEYTVIVKLSPPVLGNLEVKTVYSENGGVSINITASNPDTAAAIETKSSALRDEISAVFSGQGTQLNVNIDTSDKSNNGYNGQYGEETTYTSDETFKTPVLTAVSADSRSDNSYMV
jgi:hypothetical protein